MTFKHTKFEDSPTMRALEKVAKEKGLVKDEPLRKTASTPKKPNYTPSTNLMENVLKLCAGLRNQGLVKEAAELETNFLNYKQAQTLYETSKEKGEDLVQSAHPKGSHKLEGVEGDEAVFEDILDQHMKHVEMVNKKPTGKLSTAQAISAVKHALGQGQPQETEDSVIRKKEELLGSMPKEFGGIVQMVTIHGDSEWATIDKKKIQEKSGKVNSVLGVRPFNRTELNSLKGAYNDFIKWSSDSGAFEDSIWNTSEHNAQGKALWKEHVSGLANSFSGKIAQLDKLLTQQENIQVGREQGTYKEPTAPSVITLPEQTIASDPLVVKLQGLIGRLNSFKGVMSISRDPQANKWIDDEIKEISAMQDRIDDIAENQPAQRKSMDARYQRDYATFEQEVNQFQKDWVD